jgi:hypothetical protein
VWIWGSAPTTSTFLTAKGRIAVFGPEPIYSHRFPKRSRECRRSSQNANASEVKGFRTRPDRRTVGAIDIQQQFAGWTAVVLFIAPMPVILLDVWLGRELKIVVVGTPNLRPWHGLAQLFRCHDLRYCSRAYRLAAMPLFAANVNHSYASP